MKTFEEWNTLGFFIIKGEKSGARNKEGKPLFSREQVRGKVERENDSVDYLADAEFWAEANPMALYLQSIKEPHRHYSERAGAILARNLK